MKPNGWFRMNECWAIERAGFIQGEAICHQPGLQVEFLPLVFLNKSFAVAAIRRQKLKGAKVVKFVREKK